MKFIHTADWQIGKPFSRMEDAEKRARLRQQRIEVIRRIAEAAAAERAEFVLVAGDLFDSPTPDQSTVSAICSAIGSIRIPVLAIPGNHDHAGPGCIWEHEFFLREQKQLAPNFRILLKPEPVTVSGCVVLPCPLTQRQQSDDPTAWLSNTQALAGLDKEMPRIVLAHGSVQGFTSASDEEEGNFQPNRLDLDRLAPESFDYLALGDWHGTKRISDTVWYAGTPELDRFPKEGGQDPGNILLVDIPGRGRLPQIKPYRTAAFNWLRETFAITGPESLSALQSRLDDLLGTRAQDDLLELNLEGHLGVTEDGELQRMLESLRARLLRLKLNSSVQVMPSDDEIQTLTQRASDPIIASIARKLQEELQQSSGDHGLARQAFRELYASVISRQGGNHAS